MFANFFWILFRPRQTMHRILDSGRGGRWVIPLVLLAFFARSLSTTELKEARAALGLESIAIFLATIFVAAVVVTLLFYGFAWLVTIVGRLLEGTGSARDVRIALAWGFAPMVWSLLFRVPATILLQQMNMPESADVGPAAIFEAIERGGCALVLVFLALDVIFLIWYAIVAVVCLAEAHGFSIWKALAVLAIVFTAPVVIIVAAVLALST